MHPILRWPALYDASITVALAARFDALAHLQAALLDRQGYVGAGYEPELRILRRLVRDAARLRRLRAEMKGQAWST